MQDLISYLQQKRVSPFLSLRSQTNTWFLLDRVRGTKTLPAFFEQHGLIASIDNLVIGTQYSHLEEAGPLLIKLNHIQVSDAICHCIQRERSGIFIQSEANTILAHLQYLFVMNSESMGLVYARYYDPTFWISAQTSLPEQHASLWGDINWVYTLFPTNTPGARKCIEWQNPVPFTQRISALPEAPVYLTPTFYDTITDVKLFYFLYTQPQTIPEQRRAEIIINLKIFAQAGLGSIYLLESLLDLCIAYPNIALRSDVQAILNKDSLPIQKRDDIIALFN